MILKKHFIPVGFSVCSQMLQSSLAVEDEFQQRWNLVLKLKTQG